MIIVVIIIIISVVVWMYIRGMALVSQLGYFRKKFECTTTTGIMMIARLNNTIHGSWDRRVVQRSVRTEGNERRWGVNLILILLGMNQKYVFFVDSSVLGVFCCGFDSFGLRFQSTCTNYCD